MAITPKISVQADDFVIENEISQIKRGRANIGAVIAFTGLCRNEGGRLAALELEHYPGMAEAQIAKIAETAIKRWPLLGLTIIHRFGKITPGENIVLVIAASAHRSEAFEAAGFIMDFLKTEAPFWKKEHLVSGDDGKWVSANNKDEKAKGRWGKHKPKK